jgi:hypothetical protein
VPVQIGKNGEWAVEYFGPYAGIDTQTPENLLADNASPALSNFMLRNKELRSRPALIQPFPGVTGSVGHITSQLGISSFVDINGMYHTVTWNRNFLYQFNPALLPGDPWVAMVGAPSDMQTNTVAYRAFANSIYYASVAQPIGKPHAGGGGGGFPPSITPFLAYWNGIDAAPVFTHTFSDASVSNSIAGISRTDSPTVGASLPGSPTIVGPIAIGGQYLGELNNQIILANVLIEDQNNSAIYNFPNLIWWSANGLPLQWDPTQNTSAGFNPFLDVPDLITGMVTLGVAGYIFRTNGITEFAPTGSAVTPFRFDHMWASDHGIGAVLPFSIAQYGPTAAFIAIDNIYTLGLTSATPIGGTARDAIMADLAAMPSPTGVIQPFANIIPIYKKGYVYLTYKIFIPFPTFMRVWTYSFEDKNWAPWDLPITYNSPFPSMVCAPNVV